MVVAIFVLMMVAIGGVVRQNDHAHEATMARIGLCQEVQEGKKVWRNCSEPRPSCPAPNKGR